MRDRRGPSSPAGQHDVVRQPRIESLLQPARTGSAESVAE
jgi:hypothetical protein